MLLERSEQPRANVADGEVIGEYGGGGIAVLLFRLHGPRLAPEREYDLEIELPMYVYERLGLATRRVWTLSISREALHLLRAEPADDRSAPPAGMASLVPAPASFPRARHVDRPAFGPTGGSRGHIGGQDGEGIGAEKAATLGPRSPTVCSLLIMPW